MEFLDLKQKFKKKLKKQQEKPSSWNEKTKLTHSHERQTVAMMIGGLLFNYESLKSRNLIRWTTREQFLRRKENIRSLPNHDPSTIGSQLKRNDRDAVQITENIIDFDNKLAPSRSRRFICLEAIDCRWSRRVILNNRR